MTSRAARHSATGITAPETRRSFRIGIRWALYGAILVIVMITLRSLISR